jgi:hypothetical protein
MPTNPTTPEQEDSHLRAIYDRCDVSNNRVYDALGFDEFEAAIQAMILEAQLAENNYAERVLTESGYIKHFELRRMELKAQLERLKGVQG